MTLLIISPHLDDAVLSCGQLLAAHPDATIVTVMAGVPKDDVPLTKFDVDSGFTSARKAVEVRREEDARACTVLGATPRHMTALDRQYGVTNDSAAIVSVLTTEIEPFDDIYVPLGLLHPDHELVAQCALAAAKHLGRNVTIYGDLPGWVLQPLALEPALRRHLSEGEGWDLVLAPDLTQTSSVEIKRAAAACYRSQAWAIPDRWYMVPELYWRATWKA